MTMDSLNKKIKRLIQPVVVHNQIIEGRRIYTFFAAGQLVELPTKWLRFLTLEPRYSPQTVGQYATNIKNLLTWFTWTENYKNILLDNVLAVCTRCDLQFWIGYQRETGKSANTIHNREATAKEFFDWLTSVDAGKIRSEENTVYKTDNLISLAAAKKLPKYLSAEAVILLLNGFQNENERCMAHAMFDIGVRISEALRMRCKDLPDEKQFPNGIKYFPLKIFGSKGWGGNVKERISIISSPLLARIRRYHNSAEYRFSPHFKPDDPNKPVFLNVNSDLQTARNFNKQIKIAAQRAELNPDDFSAHRFRHGAAYSILRSELGNSYVDKLVLVQQTFGHQQIKTTEIYASIPPAVLEQLNSNKTAGSKYEEAKRIFDATYLSPRNHSERRGHR